MKKPADYDSISIGSTQLPAGGYVCKIMQVKETQSKAGRDMLVVSFDIAEGDNKDHYSKIYKEDPRDKAEKKWKGNYYIITATQEGATSRDLKRFCEFTQDSNPGFKVSWGTEFEKCFVGKLIGIVFGREQFMGTNGPAWSCKPKGLYTVDAIRNGNYTMPEDKSLESENKHQDFFVTDDDAEDVPLPF